MKNLLLSTFSTRKSKKNRWENEVNILFVEDSLINKKINSPGSSRQQRYLLPSVFSSTSYLQEEKKVKVSAVKFVLSRMSSVTSKDIFFLSRKSSVMQKLRMCPSMVICFLIEKGLDNKKITCQELSRQKVFVIETFPDKKNICLAPCV